MKVVEHKIKGVFEIRAEPIVDDRGFFMRTYDKPLFEEAGLDRQWVQENHSRSEQKGIIRGLHLQLHPYAETKLVRCIIGRILDVFVDLREGSATFGQWGAIELSAEKKNIAYIPRGFAHGFCSLVKGSEVIYKVDNYYAPDYEVGLLWNDPELNIDWPVKKPILSKKDQKNMTLKEYKGKYGRIDVD